MEIENKNVVDRTYESVEEFSFSMGDETISTPSSISTDSLGNISEEVTKGTGSESISSGDSETTKRDIQQQITVSIDDLNNGTFDTKVEESEVKEEVGFEVDLGEVEDGAEVEEVSDKESALLKRIEELEKSQAAKSAFDDLETKYSKEKIVIPGVTEYDYAKLGHELAVNGNLSENTYNGLIEKGYSKELIDNHINQLKGQAQAPVQEQVVDVEATKNQYAKEMGLDNNQFNDVYKAFGEVITTEQESVFNNMTPEQQIIQLQKFQVQKMNHDQALAVKNSNKLIKAKSNVRQATKSPFDGVSHNDLVKHFNAAMDKGDWNAVNSIGAAMKKAGVSTKMF